MSIQAIKVFVADDHQIVRWGIEKSLEHETDIVIVGESASGFALISEIVVKKPDVLLLDIKMSGLDCLDLLRKISQMSIAVKVVIISAETNGGVLFEGLELGISGYLHKEDALGSTLPSYIRLVMNGELVFSEDVRRTLDSQAKRRDTDLTPGQLEVLILHARGLEAVAIAEKTGRKMNAIYQMRSRICAKLAVETMQQAVLKAISMGLVLSHEIGGNLV